MGFTNLKANAKEQLTGNILKALMLTIAFNLLMSLSAVMPFLLPQKLIFLGSFIFSAIVMVLSSGITKFYMNMSRGENASLGDLFYGVKNIGVGIKILILMTLMSIGIFIGNLLFVIPGIIFMIASSQSLYLLLDNEDISPIEAISGSMALMKGNKMAFLKLHISLIGWAILCSITFGLASIYALPYYMLCLVNFYEILKQSN